MILQSGLKTKATRSLGIHPHLDIKPASWATNNPGVYKKAELPQRWPRDEPYVWVPWKISTVL